MRNYHAGRMIYVAWLSLRTRDYNLSVPMFDEARDYLMSFI